MSNPPSTKIRRYRDWTIMKRIFSFVLPYKWEVVKLILLSLLNSLVGLAYPIGVMFIMGELTASYNSETQVFVNDPTHFTNVLFVGLGLLAVMLLGFYLKKTYTYKMSYLGQSAMLDVRRQVFDKLQILSLNYYIERPAGKIMSSVTNDVDAIANLVSNAVIQIVGDVFTVISSVAAMLLISLTLSATLLLIMPIGFVLMFFFARKSRKYWRRSRETISNITSNLQETISGSRTIKAFVTEDENIEIFKELNEADRDVNLSAARLNAFIGPIIQVLVVIGLGIILWVGAREVEAGNLDISGMIGYFLFASNFGGPFGNVSQFYNHIQLALAGGERVLTILDTKADVVEKPPVSALPLEERIAMLEEHFPDLISQGPGQELNPLIERIKKLQQKFPDFTVTPEMALATIITLMEIEPDAVEELPVSPLPLEERIAALEEQFPDLKSQKPGQQPKPLIKRIKNLQQKFPDVNVTPEMALATIISSMETAIVPKNYAIEMPRIKGSVEYRNVFFEYEKNVPVLNSINVQFRPSERVALVGFTGAGKTTFINLLSRFYDPKEGAILVDNMDLRDVTLRSLRSQMGIVLQDTFLFSGTVMENIRYGRLEATDEDIIAAAKKVNAHEFIMRLEHGYQTEVKERGSLLSVGQRQLIAFARAILANPPILILDEATSSVDPYSELIIQEALEELLKNRTSFIIAHRLSTVINSDTILVMEHGQIIQQGSHEQLLAAGGLYKHLYEMQFKEPGAKIDDADQFKRIS